MSISRDDVRAAIEQYLPRTANFSRSEDLGELDRDQIFERLTHIVLSALLVDQDSVFFSVYLSAQRLLKEVSSATEALVELDSVDQLRGISPLPPTRIENLDKLQDAQSSLLGMSAALNDDLFGINQFTSFSEDITDFLAENIVPNVLDGGNNEKTSAAIRGSLGALAEAWATVLERRGQLTVAVEEYESLDLRVQVSSTVISDVRSKILELQEALPTLTTSEHGRRSEQILIDLSAAVAALKTIALSSSPFGTVILGPLDNGFTEAEYLLTEGVATIEPLLPLLKGDDGKLFFDDVLVGTTGQTVTDGNDFTPTLADPSVLDFTSLVAVDQYLTLVNSGERYKINAVAAAALTLNGETAHLPATPQRYVVTETPPGTYFRSLDTDFWDEYTTGRTLSTIILQGSNGSWERINRCNGSDGRNIKAFGTAATLRPIKAEGLYGHQEGGSGTEGGFFDILTPGLFLSDGVVVGDELYVEAPNDVDNPYIIDVLLSEETLEVLPYFPSAGPVYSAWYISDPDAAEMAALDGDVLEDGVVVGDILHILTGTQINGYEILEILTTSLLLVDNATFVFEQGIDWEIRYSDLFFISETGNFQSNGVQPGDILEILTVGDFTVVSVDSQNQITVTPEIDEFFIGKAWRIYKDPTLTTKFTQTDVDFEAQAVGALINGEPQRIGAFVDGIQVILNAEAADVNVVRLDPDDPVTSVRIDTLTTIDAGPLNWTLRVGNETAVFGDLNNSFLQYDAGDIIVYRPGTIDERRVGIREVTGPHSVLLAGTLPQGEEDIPYAVISVVKGGAQLVVSGRRHRVISVVDQHTIEVRPPLALTIGRDVEFLIVRSGSSPLTYHLVDIPTAQTFGPSGFPSRIVGSDFELMDGRGTKGKVTARLDVDNDLRFESFNVSAQMKIGQRRAPYRLRTLISNTTNQFRTPTATTAAAGDILTVWGQDRAFEILSVTTEGSDRVLTVDGLMPARLEDQSFVVVRGGSRNHGRYLLLEDKLAGLAQDSDTGALRLAVAEVLIDFGSNTSPISSGVGADLSFDDDGDGLTDTITVNGETFITDGVEFGHRVDLLYPGAISRRTYVAEVVSQSVVKVDPPVPVSVTTLLWSISRSSVSNALDDILQLRNQLTGLEETLSLYVVEQNSTVLSVLNLLKKHRMDRAVDLFYDGKLEEFVAMASTDSSYASQARAAIQTVGGSTAVAASVSSGSAQVISSGTNLSGVDPVTGKASPSSTFASATQGQAPGTEEIETRIALSKAVTDLVADEEIRSMIQFSLDEARNRGIYELNGEIQSGVISDQDSTMPWLDKTGSVKDKLLAKVEAALAAIQDMLDHPENYNDVSEEAE